MNSNIRYINVIRNLNLVQYVGSIRLFKRVYQCLILGNGHNEEFKRYLLLFYTVFS